MRRVPESRRRNSAGALTRLTAVSRALTYALSLEEVLDITVECATDLLAVERVVLMLVDEEGLLRIRASRGVDAGLVNDFGEKLDEGLISRLGGILGPHAAAGFLGVPLVVRGAVTGLLAVVSPGGAAATKRDEWLLSALADQASVALESARSERSRSALEERFLEVLREGGHHEDALRMVGHDLKSPLSALNGYLHLLETESYGPLNDAQLATVQRLTAITGHVSALVDTILDMGRLASGSLRLQCSAVEVAPVVAEAVTMLGVAPAEAEVDIVARVPAGLFAHCHRDRLRQVLVHLLENALRYSPPQSEITVAAGTDGAEVVIRVADQGPGVPAGKEEEIFQPYRRLEGQGGAGMGLGLAIARGLVERMSGTIALDAEAAAGATFVLTLRRSEAP
ncbi:MAG TPA: ATP-binding protein [Longimicrobiales bacterium]|nr:ATP-binding protein [Longimicrobiales bacterium]